MGGARTARTGVLVALLGGVLLLLASAPGVALAAWTGAQATIVDPRGTGVVPLLNVSVTNHATNDFERRHDRPVLGGRSGLVRGAVHRRALRLGARRRVRPQDPAGPLRRAGRKRQPCRQDGDHRRHGRTGHRRRVGDARGRRPARLPVRGPRRRVAAGVRDDRGTRPRRHPALRRWAGSPRAPARPSCGSGSRRGQLRLARRGGGPGGLGAGTPGVRQRSRIK